MVFRRRRDTVQRLYESVLAQARNPRFYGAGWVADTVDGRFELLALHMTLAISGLQAGGPKGQALAQDLFDAFVRDMDASLRELGTSDARFGKRMRYIVEAFYGRAKAYGEALDKAPDGAPDEGEDAALREALARNLFGGAAQQETLDRMAAYCRAASAMLAARPVDSWCDGTALFPAESA
jgi:cytochrome b pre-mRNA-processing protein 3